MPDLSKKSARLPVIPMENVRVAQIQNGPANGKETLVINRQNPPPDRTVLISYLSLGGQHEAP